MSGSFYSEDRLKKRAKEFFKTIKLTDVELKEDICYLYFEKNPMFEKYNSKDEDCLDFVSRWVNTIRNVAKDVNDKDIKIEELIKKNQLTKELKTLIEDRKDLIEFCDMLSYRLYRFSEKCFIMFDSVKLFKKYDSYLKEI